MTMTIHPIKDYFTDEQWDMIFDALSEYQDHDDEIDLDVLDDTIDKIRDLFQEA